MHFERKVRARAMFAYHFEVILIPEPLIAIYAVGLMMSLLIRVLIRHTLCIERIIRLVRRLPSPVAQRIHVLVRCSLRVKRFAASLAFKAGPPVASISHMLVCGVLRSKLSVASLALEERRPMPQGIHVLICRIL